MHVDESLADLITLVVSQETQMTSTHAVSLGNRVLLSMSKLALVRRSHCASCTLLACGCAPHTVVASAGGIMAKLALPLLAALVLLAPPAIGATTSTVVDIPTPRGATQRILYVRPDSPKAIMVWITSGDGVLGIQDNGTMFNGSCPAIPRNRLAFAERGIALALVDAPSDLLIRQLTDVSEVIRHVRARDAVPIWLAGGSMSTAATASFATALPASDPIGAIFHAPYVVSYEVELIRRPTFVIYHAQDPYQVGSSFYASLYAAPVKQEEVMSGGNAEPCGLIGYHTFQGLDDQFVAAVAGFIDKHNASLSPPPASAVAVEYFNAGFDHYFMTAQADEIALLDGGAYGGAFVRTGRSFKVHDTPAAGTVPVCRFFTMPGRFGAKSSHFYSADPAECEIVKTDPAWISREGCVPHCGAGERRLRRGHAAGVPRVQRRADRRTEPPVYGRSGDLPAVHDDDGLAARGHRVLRSMRLASGDADLCKRA